ncbi:unnamed protein product [Prunus armeniaca]
MTVAVVQRSENLRFEPVATVGGSRTLRSGFWVGQVRDFTTSRTEPVSGAGVARGDGGVENSVQVNSDERERVRGRERTHGREREESELKMEKSDFFYNYLFDLFTILPPEEISSPTLRYNSDSSLPPVYEFISEPLTQLNHLWSQNPSGQENDQNTLPQG